MLSARLLLAFLILSSGMFGLFGKSVDAVVVVWLLGVLFSFSEFETSSRKS